MTTKLDVPPVWNETKANSISTVGVTPSEYSFKSAVVLKPDPTTAAVGVSSEKYVTYPCCTAEERYVAIPILNEASAPVD